MNFDELHYKQVRIQDAIYCLKEAGIVDDYRLSLEAKLGKVNAEIAEYIRTKDERDKSLRATVQKLRNQLAVMNRNGALYTALTDRDGCRCKRCGAEPPSELTIDHILPLTRGGTNALDNLQLLCRPCNSSKGAR